MRSLSLNQLLFINAEGSELSIKFQYVQYVDLDRIIFEFRRRDFSSSFHFVVHTGYAITIRVRGSARFNSRAKISRAHEKATREIAAMHTTVNNEASCWRYSSRIFVSLIEQKKLFCGTLNKMRLMKGRAVFENVVALVMDLKRLIIVCK